MMRSEESGRGKLTKAFKVSAANGFCGNSLICLLIYFHQPPVYPQLMLQCVTKFFQESVYILSWGRRIYSLLPTQYLGCRVDYSLVPPSSTISPVMRQRDYQLLRFPHSNINIALSSHIIKGFASGGLSIIPPWQRDYPSCAQFICASQLPLSLSSPAP